MVKSLETGFLFYIYLRIHIHLHVHIHKCTPSGSASVADLRTMQDLIQRMVPEEQTLKDKFLELILDYTELVFQFD